MRAIEEEFILGKSKLALNRRPKALAKNKVMKNFQFKYVWEELGFPFSGPCYPTGSNSWVVSKQFAGGDKTFLANDPHLPLFYPSTFQEVALDSTPAGGTYRAKGMSIPGIPGLFVGTMTTSRGA